MSILFFYLLYFKVILFLGENLLSFKGISFYIKNFSFKLFINDFFFTISSVFNSFNFADDFVTHFLFFFFFEFNSNKTGSDNAVATSNNFVRRNLYNRYFLIEREFIGFWELSMK